MADVHREVLKLATLVRQYGISEEIVKEVKTLVQNPTKLSDEDAKEILIIIIAILKTQKKGFIRKAGDIIVALKKSKSLNWKKHTDEAKEMLKIIGELPIENKDKVDEYEDFLKKLLDLLKRGKGLSEVQGSLVDCFFNCFLINMPMKSDLAVECSARDIMDLSKQPALRQEVLEGCVRLLQMEDLPNDNRGLNWAMGNIVERVVESYDNNGTKVTDEENQLLISIFKIASEGADTIEEQFYQENNESIPNIYLSIWRDALTTYITMHQSSRTLSCIAPIMPNILKWAKAAAEDENDLFQHYMFSKLNMIGLSPPPEFKDILPEIVDIMLSTEKCNELLTFITQLYPHNPKAVHDRLQNLLDAMENMKDNERGQIAYIFLTVAQAHPEAFSKQQISVIFDRYRKGGQQEQMSLLMVIRSISEKHPSNLSDFFLKLCDDSVFKPDSLNLRSGIISCIGGINETLGQKAVDYLMKYADHSDTTISLIVVGTISTMVREHVEYMQKHKSKLEQLEESSTMPQLRDIVHDMILELEGKSLENIADDVQQQQEDIIELDTKVDTTVNTVIAIGDKVIEHDKDIGDLEEGLAKIEERVDDVEEDIDETKIKVEEIDNKTMSNAPRWSRDLTKLMNPEAENDWRLLARRLGYGNDDIRGWATQHDPCMALLSEWYATHKTSEANFGIMNALTEMNRMDGVAIVENAMKAAEGVVEDEEFEYPSPPPVFISYQWGFQNEVKLLKQHLNMAGYECWMDVGQMGGGDKLFAKIDNGIRGAKVVICCVTDKYAQSPNCNREVNLSVNLNKPIIPLLMEKMDWPPKGSMGPIFSEYLFIRFFQRGGEETTEGDQRYWPVPKFQELLMQLNFFVVPDPQMVQKEYSSWWAPIAEDIVIDKTKSKKQQETEKPRTKGIQIAKPDISPLVFLSYQWSKQPQVKALYQRLTSLGYTVWMDIYQMGGGDSLYDKIDRGMRGCKAVVSCVTQKYTLSANCRREISLADALKKPIIPLLLEQIKWPPDGPMSMVFTELLYINFYRDEAVQMTWAGEQFNELKGKLVQFVPDIAISVESKDKMQRPRESETKTARTNNIRKETTTNHAKSSRKTATHKITDSIDTEVDTRGSRINGSKGNTEGQNLISINTQTAKKKGTSSKNVLTKAASVGAFSSNKKSETDIRNSTSGSRKPVNGATKKKETKSGAAIVNSETTELKWENATPGHSDVIPTAPDRSNLYSDNVVVKTDTNDDSHTDHNKQPEVVLSNSIKPENNQKSSSCSIL